MSFIHKLKPLLLGLAFFLAFTVNPVMAKEAKPSTIVLTFDDSVASHATFVAPLLKKHGFCATFFIT